MPTLAAATPVLGVLGASGGLGASTLAAALAVAATRELAASGLPPAVAVDGALGGGGLDTTACVEHLPGLRWPDLAGVRGEVCGADVVAELPRCAGGARVLAAAPGAPPPQEVVSSVVQAVRAAAGLVVVDLPGAAPEPGGDGATEPLLDACDAVLLLAGVTPRHLADAVATRTRLAARLPAGSVLLVVRGGPRSRGVATAMADHLGLALAGCWRDDRRVVLDAERGRAPGDGPRSGLASLSGLLLERVAHHRRAA
jgi:MinD-like ATPase involved in chromosome partitioning or flagellar assembly